MPKYEVILTHVQYSRGSVVIEAKNYVDAKEQADLINSDECDNYNTIDGEISVESVTQLPALRRSRAKKGK